VFLAILTKNVKLYKTNENNLGGAKFLVYVKIKKPDRLTWLMEFHWWFGLLPKKVVQ
jgi:hypothetical protein